LSCGSIYIPTSSVVLDPMRTVSVCVKLRKHSPTQLRSAHTIQLATEAYSAHWTEDVSRWLIVYCHNSGSYLWSYSIYSRHFIL